MKKPIESQKTKPSVAERIVDRLQGFTELLEKNERISAKFTCRRIILNLQPTSYNAHLVKKTRELLGASQALFAQFLGVSPKTVRAWEQGQNVPSDMACRFMDEIRRNPKYWLDRLKQAVQAK